jgi:hypothetical protein
MEHAPDHSDIQCNKVPAEASLVVVLPCAVLGELAHIHAAVGVPVRYLC